MSLIVTTSDACGLPLEQVLNLFKDMKIDYTKHQVSMLLNHYENENFELTKEVNV